MKIAVAQYRSVAGDITANVAGHLELIELAVVHGARFIAFPELSLTGYEPRMAGELAIDLDDPCLQPFQQASAAHGIRIAIGVPTKTAEAKPRISLALFQPHRPRGVYSKQFLHADEEPFFVPGPRNPGVLDTAPKIGLAICYELSVPAHAEATFIAGAEVYLASVAETERGIAGSHPRLAELAKCFDAPVLLANCVGMGDGGYCAGNSAAWNPRGERLARLDDTSEGLVVFDTEREEALPVEA
jgi:predicted amidohydrolase